MNTYCLIVHVDL